MALSLIRGKYVICKIRSRTAADVIEDGAVVQRDGTILAVGPYAALAQQYQPDETFGSAEHVVMPGFVNSHHHVGLTPFQLGSPDYPLELWFASRMAARSVDRIWIRSIPPSKCSNPASPPSSTCTGYGWPRCHGCWQRRANPQGLPGHRHAGVVLLCAAGSEPARLRSR